MAKAAKQSVQSAVTTGKVVALAQSKGGVGKSTTAVNEAIFLATEGFLVTLIDLGRQRESFDPLVERRENHPELPQVAAWTPWKDFPVGDAVAERIEATHMMIQRFTESGAHVVIDCPPVDSEDSPLVSAALQEADIVVCPFLGGGNDYKAYGRALTMAHELKMGGRHPVLLAFVNKFSGQDNDDQVIRGALQGSGVFSYIGEVPRDVAVKRSTVNKLAVWEWRPRSHGAKGMLSVCGKITAYLTGGVVE